MIPPGTDPNHWLFIFGGGVLGVSIVACLWRLIKGPTLADRVVALDLIGFLVVGVIALFSIFAGSQPLLSVAMIAAIILFVGTAAFAIYIERSGTR